MRCDRSERWFSRARDGELPKRQRRRLAAHLRNCRLCRLQYRQFRRSCQLLRQADPAREVTMPPGLADDVVQRLQLEERPLAEGLWRHQLDGRVALGIAATMALLLWGDELHLLDELPDGEKTHLAPMEP